MNVRSMLAWSALFAAVSACVPVIEQTHVPEAPAPAMTTPPPAAVPAPEPSEATCTQLVSVPGDGVARIMFQVTREDDASGLLHEYVKVVDQWFRCVPRFKEGSLELRTRAIEALRHLDSVLEEWYCNSKGSPKAYDYELIGVKHTIERAEQKSAIRSGAKQKDPYGEAPDRRDVARAFWRVESELRRGRTLGPTPDMAARAAAPRELGVLMLRVDAVAGYLSLVLIGGEPAEDLATLIDDYRVTLGDEARAWSLAGTEQADGAPINPTRTLARGAVVRGRAYDPRELQFIDNSISDRVLLIQHQAELLGQAWAGRSNEAFRDAIGLPIVGYLDVLSNIESTEKNIPVPFLAPLPTPDGAFTRVKGKLAWLALTYRAAEGGNLRGAIELAEAEKRWELLLREKRPEALGTGAEDDAQDPIAMAAVQAMVSAAKHIISPRVRIEVIAQATTRLNLVVAESQQQDPGTSAKRYFIRRRLSRVYAESALCLTAATIRGTPLEDCEHIAIDPRPTTACDRAPGSTQGLPPDALSGSARDGMERILQVLALHADISAKGAITASGATVGWSHRTRCAAEMLADASIYPHLGAGVAGDASMLRLIASLQLRPSEPSVRAIAEATFKHAQASLTAACHDVRGEGCDAAVLAKLASEKRNPVTVKKGGKPVAPAPDPTLLRVHNFIVYCDAAFQGGDAYLALQTRPAGSVSIAQHYWHGTIPGAINNIGAGVYAERGFCMADGVYDKIKRNTRGSKPPPQQKKDKS